MPLQSSQIVTSRASQSAPKEINKGLGTVYSVILDETHPIYKQRELDASQIGAIVFRFNAQIANDDSKLPLALPIDKNFKSLPVRNEIVEIYTSNSGVHFYKRIGGDITPYVDNDGKTISKLFSSEKQPEQTSAEYSKVSSTGIQRTNADESTKYDGYGEYFVSQKGIHKLKLYEGDTLLETRFGQSIRFSGYNNSEKTFSPTIIIRNSENAESKQKELKTPTEEDINKDGTILAITSNQYQLPFLPGTVDDGGTSDFQTKPNSFKNYPSQLKGDQVLLNSGRIILSAKNAEMIFFSKKNYGFISDGGLSIDNKLGIDVNVGDTTNIKTNDRDVNFNTGNGKINLGDKELEPLVKGDKWVAIMEELIDAITQQTYLTPSGPSKVGPENLPTFNSIKNKLKTALSNLNKTS